MPSAVVRARRLVLGLVPTIKTVYVGALTIYALLGAPVLSPWVNVVAVAGILAAVPVGVVVLNVLTAPRDEVATLLRPTADQRGTPAREMDRAHSQGVGTWWSEIADRARWFDEYFAYWWKYVGIPADDIHIRLTHPALTPSTYEGVPSDLVEPRQPHRKKAALVRASNLLSDSVHELDCAPFDYELATWVSHHPSAFASANGDVSVFGLDESIPYPGVLCSHNVLMTADGWVVWSLRNSRTDFHPNAWSVSFEEQVEVGRRLDGAQQLDLTLGDTVRRGVAEEFGQETSDAIAALHTVAIGSEIVDTPARSVRGGAPLTVVELSFSRAELWRSLRRPAAIRDADEATAWMAIRFARAQDAVALLTGFPPNSRKLHPQRIREAGRIAAEVSVHPTSTERLAEETGFGWHPTSRVRLLLWSQWAVAHGYLSD
ncbi:hypothetical protein G5V58_19530 [Nocardioides anomalus]|uniref:Uncharacterized protein n=1 Tax=Nocardioides anomalus TaxID=2712223 RepID=A0A6G6WHN8_9ACTN|nr:hypothetical protein [Nocardioides anomalus]QIG44677.1 hypothetical protein G5V58_19530 [Nocardioides anomalus]